MGVGGEPWWGPFQEGSCVTQQARGRVLESLGWYRQSVSVDLRLGGHDQGQLAGA